jgi:hypothetical protein
MSKRDELRDLVQNAATTYFGKPLTQCTADERAHCREVAEQTWNSQNGRSE